MHKGKNIPSGTGMGKGTEVGRCGHMVQLTGWGHLEGSLDTWAGIAGKD